MSGKMEPTFDISVVICTFNRAKQLRDCLERLIVQDTLGQFSYEILVVDNGSTDTTPQVVKELQRRSQVAIRYFFEATPGLAFARNRGLIEYKGDWILCFDDDLLAGRSCLAELFSLAESTGADCVGGRMLVDLPHAVRRQLRPGLLGLVGHVDYGSQPRKYTGKNFPPDPMVLRRRNVFESVGKFDTSMIRGGQDLELTRRVLKAGFKIWYSPKAVAYHTVKPHRLEEDYLHWTSLRHGQSYAYMDFKHKGPMGMAALAFARAGQAFFVNIPVLIFSFLVCNRGEALWRKCLLWRLVGYLRTGVFLIAPQKFPQDAFFGKIEFRKEKGR